MEWKSEWNTFKVNIMPNNNWRSATKGRHLHSSMKSFPNTYFIRKCEVSAQLLISTCMTLSNLIKLHKIKIWFRFCLRIFQRKCTFHGWIRWNHWKVELDQKLHKSTWFSYIRMEWYFICFRFRINVRIIINLNTAGTQ